MSIYYHETNELTKSSVKLMKTKSDLQVSSPIAEEIKVALNNEHIAPT